MYSSTSTYSEPSGIQSTPGGKPVPVGKNALDCFTFGMIQPGRSYNSGDYRYGFQGQEKDDEIKGTGNSVNYKYRMHDPRLGRFFSVDPLTAKYPHYTPYSFSGNKVIAFIELEGLEEFPATGADWEAGLGTGNDGDGAKEGGQPGPVKEVINDGTELLFDALEAVGESIGTARNSVVNAITDVTRDAMGTLEYQTGLPSGNTGDMTEAEVFASMNNEAAALYNAIPHVAGESSVLLLEVAIMGAMTTASPKVAVVNEETIAAALKGSVMETLQGRVSLPMVERYVRLLEAGSVAPAISVDGAVIVEGNHRYVAARILGLKVATKPGYLSPSQLSKVKPMKNTTVDPVDWSPTGN